MLHFEVQLRERNVRLPVPEAHNLYSPYGNGAEDMESLGIEATRRRLPELVAAAREGKTTLITRHGRPLAALVPVDDVARRRLPTAMRDLRGCATGAWGEDPARAVEGLRDEWNP